MKVLLEAFLFFLFSVPIVTVALGDNDTVLPEPHLTIIGSTGTGKSTLGNVLLGCPPDSTNCTFPVCGDHQSCTKNTTYGIGKRFFVKKTTNGQII